MEDKFHSRLQCLHPLQKSIHFSNRFWNICCSFFVLPSITEIRSDNTFIRFVIDAESAFIGQRGQFGDQFIHKLVSINDFNLIGN